MLSLPILEIRSKMVHGYVELWRSRGSSVYQRLDQEKTIETVGSERVDLVHHL